MKKGLDRRFIAIITAAFIFVAALIIAAFGFAKFDGNDRMPLKYAFAQEQNGDNYPQGAKRFSDSIVSGWLFEGTYYLSDDYTLKSKLTITGTVNLYLNNHTLSMSGSTKCLVVGTGTLNIYGDGGIVNSAFGTACGVKLESSDSQLNVYGGKILASSSEGTAYGIDVCGGVANIFGGEVAAESAGNGFEACGVNVAANNFVSVEGGKISGSSCAVNLQPLANAAIVGGDIAGEIGVTGVGATLTVCGGNFNCAQSDVSIDKASRIYASINEESPVNAGISKDSHVYETYLDKGYVGTNLNFGLNYEPAETDIIVNAVRPESRDKFVLKGAEAPFTLLYNEEKQTLSYGHEHVMTYDYKSYPTCTSEGLMVGVCTVPTCAHQTDEVLPMLPHSVTQLEVGGQPERSEYIAFESFDCTGLVFSAVCGECGYKFGVENYDISYICGDELQFGDEFITVSAVYDGKKLSCMYPVSVGKVEMDKVSADPTEFIYNGNVQTYMPTGFDSKTMTIGGNSFKDANGEGYQVTVSLADTKNYCWKNGGTEDIVLPFVIGKKSVTINDFSVADTTYGGEYGGVNAENAVIQGLADGDEVQLKTTYFCGDDPLDTAPKGAGEYTVEISLNNGNYEIDGDTKFTYKIDKAPLTVTAQDSKIFYGEEAANGGVNYVGFVLDEDESALGGNLEYTYDYARFNGVGEYKVTPCGLTSDNYEITFKEGVLTVSPLPITVNISAACSDYGGAVAGLNATITDGEILEADKDVFALSTIATSSSNAGNYDICGTVLNKNYDITFVGGAGAYTVNKATVDISGITFNDASIIFDGQQHNLQIEGKLPDGVSVSYVGNGKSECGEYTVTAYFSVDETNFNKINPMSAVLKIGTAISPNEPQADSTTDDDQSSVLPPPVGTKSDVNEADSNSDGKDNKAKVAVIVSVVCTSLFTAAAVTVIVIKIFWKRRKSK